MRTFFKYTLRAVYFFLFVSVWLVVSVYAYFDNSRQHQVAGCDPTFSDEALLDAKQGKPYNTDYNLNHEKLHWSGKSCEEMHIKYVDPLVIPVALPNSPQR